MGDKRVIANKQCGGCLRFQAGGEPCAVIGHAMLLLNEGTDDEWLGSLDRFVEGNEDMDPEAIGELHRLGIGETYRDGGGAQPEWTARRVA